MAKKKKEDSFVDKFGPWAFVIGLIVAVISALTRQVFWMLSVLGLIVGLLNITEKESNTYLLASLTFLVSANALSVTLTQLMGIVPLINNWMVIINPLLANITMFVAPGAGIVALKALYSVSKN
jgi:hypothetical protein